MISDSQACSKDGDDVVSSTSANDAHDNLKTALDDLIVREARFRKITDMLFDGILIIQDGVIVETNHGLLSMTGHEASELVGHKIEELDGWQDLGKSLAVVPDELISFETLLPRRSSRAVYATVRARRVSLRDPAVVIAVIAGMTEDEPASASLLRSAERYRSLFEAIPDLVFTKDQNLRFSEVNPAMEKVLRLSASEIIGRTSEEIYGQEVGERIRAWDCRVLSGETIEDEHTIPMNGEKLVFHEVRVPIRNSAGDIIGVCGIGRDVTERRSAMLKPGIVPSGHRSKAMKDTMELAGQAAKTDSIVLLLGESGSGKDYLARWIHEHSRRQGSPFLTINCAAVPQDLAESELFGHESGAFTGARSRKKGLLELAEGGTLLLNEIAEMSPSLQSKLLVFLDSRSFLRLGGQKPVHVDARILAATHKALEAEVDAGRFSKPLFYRLNVFPIRVPPLRYRIEDIPHLSRELLAKVAEEMNLSRIPAVDPESLKSLTRYVWPGNVRELRNVLEKGLILWQSGKLKLNVPFVDSDADDCSFQIALPTGKKLKELSKEFERLICVEAIRRSGGNRSAAARSLGLSRDSLYRYLRSGAPSQGTSDESDS
ncbi:MAG TPA: sigma 54-interacting transcriptional regulator [Desulfomonilaceae bacterium]|nr:sigma 54-interacting transcriptional regulator [Desulfomonilaceae bacterium]